MTIEEFIERNEYLYHLTDRNNLDTIIENRRIYSTAALVSQSDLPNRIEFLRTRRPIHCVVTINGTEYRIRDQRPISMVALSKCLTNGWQTGDFIEHLNRRVFFWPNKQRLETHYQRYQNENPVILRFSSADILSLHPEAEFSRLNSGATRANSYLGGIAPLRGEDTFQTAANFNLSPRLVVEVTIPNFCNLSQSFFISDSPNGEWVNMTI